MTTETTTAVAETAHKDVAEKAERPKAATETTCANGHLRADHWTVTAGGRKYCKQCAREASARTRAKNPVARKRTTLSDDALSAILRMANFKNTSADVRDELVAFVESRTS